VSTINDQPDTNESTKDFAVAESIDTNLMQRRYGVAIRNPTALIAMAAFVAIFVLPFACNSALLATKLVYIATPIMLLLVAASFACKRLPLSTQRRMEDSVRDEYPVAAPLFENLSSAVDQLRPFFYGAIFIAKAPITIWCTVGDWALSVFKVDTNTSVKQISGNTGKVILRQNVPKTKPGEQQPFYSTPAFSITLLAIAICGIPGAITLAIFSSLGLDPLYGYPTKLAAWPAAKLAFFQLTGLGCCVCPLLVRSILLLPEKHTSWESAIEMDATGVRKGNVKGWFSDLAFYTFFSELFPWRVKWNQIEKVEYVQSGFGRMSPLPATLFSAASGVHKTLAPIAEFSDAVVDRAGRAEWIVLRKHNDVDFSPGLRIRLWDLDEHDRALLFYSIRRWAPTATIDHETRKVLIGDGAIARGTDQTTSFWHNLLLQTENKNQDGLLSEGDTVHDGKYKIQSHLTTGGQANLYVAESTDAGIKVVLKEYVLANTASTLELISSAEFFENEASLLSRMQHPSIVRMLDMFSQSGRAFIVLEYLEGKSLADIVRDDGVMPSDRVRDIAKQLCDVLLYLHSQTPSTVHRDLTPENILVSGDGIVKLIDFSVASCAVKPGSGPALGKRAYMPPEQFRGEISPSCDIYALGCVLYFLTTGRDPIPLSQSSIGEDVCGVLDKVIRGCTHINPDDRYESVNWIALDLS